MGPRDTLLCERDGWKAFEAITGEIVLVVIRAPDGGKVDMARAALERRPDLLRLLEVDGKKFSAMFPSRWKTGRELVQMVKIGALPVEDVKDAVILCGPRSFLYLLRDFPHHLTDDDVLRVFTTAELWEELRRQKQTYGSPESSMMNRPISFGKRKRQKMNAIFLLVEARPSLAEKLSVHEVMES